MEIVATIRTAITATNVFSSKSGEPEKENQFGNITTPLFYSDTLFDFS